MAAGICCAAKRGLQPWPAQACLRRMAGMPISGLTWHRERARKFLNDSLKHDTSKSGEENVRIQWHSCRQR
ncbi:MAG: hypothetical protein E5W25_11560, partial [Mesorhizobium sp.]